MACHQAHNIPWATLASHFKYAHCARGLEGRTNLHPRFREHQGKVLHYFINAFTKNISLHTDVEVRKYPDATEPLSPEATILTPDTIRRISPSLHHATKDLALWDEFTQSHTSIPPKYTKTQAFLHASSNQGWSGHEVFYSLELFKLLILHGDMNTLQQICQHPQAAWEESWEKHYDMYGDQNTCGWAYVPRLALKAYLSLNLLLCFPELWDDESGRSEQIDYRNTKCYQRMLRECTLSDLSTNIAALPHRQFFGIPDEHFRGSPYWTGAGKYSYLLQGCYSSSTYPYGLVPILDFLELESSLVYMPTVPDILHVRWCLCKLGLPTEIATEIMDFAGYTPTRRLEHPHDPLHRSNREELRQYLDYCWNILVRCDVMARWLGSEIPWERVIADTLVQLVGHGSCGPVKHEKKFYERRFDEDTQWSSFRESEVFTFL